MLTVKKKKAYLSILSEELVPATGCTEPIALAYAAARLRDILGVWPEKIRAEVSGNIIKNVKIQNDWNARISGNLLWKFFERKLGLI